MTCTFGIVMFMFSFGFGVSPGLIHSKRNGNELVSVPSGIVSCKVDEIPPQPVAAPVIAINNKQKRTQVQRLTALSFKDGGRCFNYAPSVIYTRL